MTSCDTLIAGEHLLLLPQKAAFWPKEKILMIADIHFGKAGAFRRLGVPVPHGTTAQNLLSLDELIGIHQPRHIVFLGDFFHAKSMAKASLQTILSWRLRHPELQLTLIRGNHDLHAGDPPAAMGMVVVTEPYRIGAFAFCHHPDIVSDAYVIAGHVHPAFRLVGRHESMRLPCFVIGSSRAILPSFGAFTGGYTISKQVDETIFVIADDSVLKV